MNKLIWILIIVVIVAGVFVFMPKDAGLMSFETSDKINTLASYNKSNIAFSTPAVKDLKYNRVGDSLNITWNNGNNYATIKGSFWYEGEQYSYSEAQATGVIFDYWVVRDEGTIVKWGGSVNLDSAPQIIKDNGYYPVFELIDVSNGTEYKRVGKTVVFNDQIILNWIDKDNPTNVFQVYNKTTAFLTDEGNKFYDNLIYDPQIESVNITLGFFNQTVFNGSAIILSGTNETGTYSTQVIALNASYNRTNVTISSDIPAGLSLESRIAEMRMNISEGLLGFWIFDGEELGSSTCTDLSGNGNSGTYRADTEGITNGLHTERRRVSEGDGSGSNVGCDFQSSTTLSSISNAVTLYYEFNRTSNDQDDYILNFDDRLRIQTRTGTTMRFTIIGLNNTAVDSITGAFQNTNEWYRGIMFYNGTTICSENINGTGRCAPAGGTITPMTNNFVLGSRHTSASNEFRGQFDNVIVWNRSLSNTEKLCLRNRICLTNWTTTLYQQHADGLNTTRHIVEEDKNFQQIDFRFTGNSTHTPVINAVDITVFTPRPTTPTNMTCDDGSCDGNFSTSVKMNCSGSIDPESDLITYILEKGDDIIITTHFATGNYITQDSDTGNDTFSFSAENCGSECATDIFDQDTGTKWLTLFNTAWIRVRLGNGAKRSLSYNITSGNDQSGRDPDNWTISGSNDNITWDILDTKINQESIFDAFSTTYAFTMNSPTNNTYLYYKWNITAVRTPSGNIFQSSELWLIESEQINTNLTNYSVIGNHTENTSLSWDISVETNGTIYESFRCRAIDLMGSNVFSDYFTLNTTFEISAAGPDTTPPTFTGIPENKTLTFAVDALSVEFNASDASGIDRFFINDTTNFNITAGGILTNKTTLPIGGYVINVSVNDTVGNVATVNYNVTVVAAGDTKSPTFTFIPPNATLEFTTDFLSVDFNATDETEFDSFSINDTNFNINATNGTLTNATSLPIGVYIINVTINDTSNNINSTLYKVTVQDTVAPSLTAPANATLEFATDFLSVDFNAVDKSPLGNFTVNDTTNFNIATNGTLINITTIPIGTYDLNITVNDSSGNLNSTVYQIIVQDTIAPRLTSPANATLEFGFDFLSVDFDAIDKSPLGNFTVNDTTNFNIATNGTLINITNLPIGTHILNITINDSSGNINSTVYQVTVQDTRAPLLTSPANATLEFGTDFLSVDFDAEDKSALGNFTVNDTTNFNIATNGTLINITTLPIGTYDLNITINDSFGNLNSTVYKVTVQDTRAPNLISPANATLEFGTDFLSVDFQATDLSPLGNFTVNDTTNFNIATNGTLINITTVPIGTYDLNITVNDSSGNLNSTVYQIIVQDTIAPSITAPANATLEFSTDFLSVDFNAIDKSPLGNFTVNDTTNFNIATNGTLINITTLAIGTYDLNVTVNDSSGNLNSTVYQIIVQDTTPPTITGLPENKTLTFAVESLSVEFNATDASGIDRFFINDTTNFNITAGGILTNATTLPAGGYVINVSVNDTIGNVATVNYNVTILAAPTDTTPPTFTFIPPNATLEFTVDFLSVDFNATDETAFDSFAINDTRFNINASNGTLINASTIPVGIHVINVTINDTANNINSTLYQVTVQDTTAPIISGLTNSSTSNDSATISWTCNEACNFTIWWYNTTSRTLESLVGTQGDNTFLTSQSTIITGLKNRTSYFINLTVWDISGNFAENNTFDFNTSATPPPAVDNRRNLTIWRNDITLEDIAWIDNRGSWFTLGAAEIYGKVTVHNDTNITGNLTANMIYGEMWFHNDTVWIVTTITQSGVFVNITGFNQTTESGQTLNGFVYNNTHEYLSPLVNGMYDCSYDISTGNAGNNQEYNFNFFVNGVVESNSDAHRKIGSSGDVGYAGNRAFIRMSKGDRLTLAALNIDGTADLRVHAASINCVRIGT